MRRKRFLMARVEAAIKGLRTTTEDRGRKIFVAAMARRGNRLVRRALAAECSRFCFSPYTEVWNPYKTWLEGLDPALDTLITFNYDCAVEIADGLRLESTAPSTGRPRPERLDIRMPWRPGPLIEQGLECLRLLKIHGSANWSIEAPAAGGKVSSSRSMRRDGGARGFRAALEDPGATVGIAAPGGAKATFAQEDLRGLWEAAGAALQAAERIVLLRIRSPGNRRDREGVAAIEYRDAV